MYINSTSKIV